TLYAQWKSGIVISEYMYQGLGLGDIGEFIEFTNIGTVAVNMSGWSFSDNGRVAGEVSLSAFGTVQPGESVILTELPAATFRANWNLCDAVKVTGGNGVNLGRSDEINLYTAAGDLADRLTYNDQGTGTVAGVRTNGASAWVPAAAAGNNTNNQWVLSVTADSEASYASTLSEVGSPGISTLGTSSWVICVPEMTVKGNSVIIADGDATPAAADHTLFGTGLCSVGGNVVRTFTIENTGDVSLTIGTVSVTGNGFSLTQLPASSLAAINGSTTFQVSFNPAAAGVVSGNNNGTISIVNNDGTKNPYNFSISANVVVAVTPAVTISSNPAAVAGTTSICAGTSVSFTAVAANTGAGTIVYQWKLNGGNVGTNATTYTNAALANGDVVRCDITVTGSCVTTSATSSANISLLVNALPVTPNGEITPEENPTCGPTALIYEHGTTQPQAGVEYYWQTTALGTSAVNNVTNPLIISAGGLYYVRAYNGNCWSTASYVIQAPVVYNNPVSISSHPVNVSATTPATASFSVTASNAAGYQWQVNTGSGFANIAGATASAYTTAATNVAMNGWVYKCIVRGNGACAALNSNSATLTVLAGPCITDAGGYTGWINNGVTISAGQSCSGNGILFDGQNEAIITAAVTNPDKLNFNKKRSSNGDAWAMDIDISTSTAGPWTTVTTINSISNSCTANAEVDLSSYVGTYY
ncbi:MAG: choice-of-anchor D domain-containing protein, partial [Sphingobacteriales bacterium]